MLTNHLRGDNKAEDHKNHGRAHENKGQKQSGLEKLISSGKRYLAKTGRTLAFTGALTATTFIPGLMGKAFAGMETFYNKTFNIPVYQEQYNPATKGSVFSEEDVNLKLEKDKENKELRITVKQENFDKPKEHPETETYLNGSHSSPVIVHSSNIEISDIKQQAYVNEGKKGSWTDLIPPEENKKLQKGIKLEKKILKKSLKPIGIDLSDEAEEVLGRVWEKFVEYQREKQKQGYLEKTGKPRYNVTKISPFTIDRVSGRAEETARKFNISLEQKIPQEENILILQGVGLDKRTQPIASGNLEKQVIGPVSIGEFSLWSLKKGEDFEWLDKQAYDQLRIKNNGEKQTISLLNYWFSGDERIFSFMKPVKRTDFSAKVLVKDDNKEPELIDNVEVYLPGISSWGQYNMEKMMLPVTGKNMGKEHFNVPSWFIEVNLGKGKGEYKGRYIGEISFDNFYEKMKKLEDDFGRLQVYTFKRGDDKLKPAKQSNWRLKNQELPSMRFISSSNDKYSSLDDFGFGLYVVKNRHIQSEPFFYTDVIEDALYKDKLHKNIEIKKLRIKRDLGQKNGYLRVVCERLD